MRRKDREITDMEEIVSVVEKCEILHLGMSDNGTVYIVPLNFGYTVKNSRLILYVHSAKEGRKMEILKKNPVVCFEAECSCRTIRGEKPCGWTEDYESVIGNGRVEWIEDTAEKKRAMDSIMKHYGFEGTPCYEDSVFDHTCVYKILVSDVSGKRHL